MEPLIFADALVALFEQLAQPRRPVLLQLDDLQWADKATLALIGHLVRHSRRGSVYIVGTARTGRAEKRLTPLRQSALRQNALAELTLLPAVQ